MYIHWTLYCVVFGCGDLLMKHMLGIEVTVAPRPRPPVPPTAVNSHRRMSNGKMNPTLAEHIVQQTMRRCREVDHNAKLVSCVKDAVGRTIIHCRAGDVHSTSSLQAALNDAFPLSTVAVTESWLDGTLEAELIVATKSEEYARARRIVTKRRAFSYWLLLVWALFLIACVEWVLEARASRPAPSLHDEL